MELNRTFASPLLLCKKYRQEWIDKFNLKDKASLFCYYEQKDQNQ